MYAQSNLAYALEDAHEHEPVVLPDRASISGFPRLGFDRSECNHMANLRATLVEMVEAIDAAAALDGQATPAVSFWMEDHARRWTGLWARLNSQMMRHGSGPNWMKGILRHALQRSRRPHP